MLAQLARYGISGVIATLIHALIYLYLLEQGWPSLWANTAGFIPAFFWSFALQSLWVFRREKMSWLQLRGFVLSALFGYLLNSIIAYTCIDIFRTPGWVSVLVMVSITPAATFIINKYWVFK